MILAAQPESPLNAGVNAYLACHGSLHTSQVARSASLPPSSGGRSFRNARYSTTSYTTFVPPPIIKGAENARFRMTRLATAEPTAQKTLRARLLSPLANARSFGNNHRRHIGLPGGNVHFDQRLTAQKQEDCPFERRCERYSDKKETGRKVSQHHRISESDVASKPRCRPAANAPRDPPLSRSTVPKPSPTYALCPKLVWAKWLDPEQTLRIDQCQCHSAFQ